MPYKPREPEFFKSGVGYIWKDCKKCGYKSAYASNGKCPACKSEANRKYRKRKVINESGFPTV